MTPRELEELFAQDAAAAENAAPDDDALKTIAIVADKQIQLTAEMTMAEEALRDIKKRLFKVQTEDLPKAMEDAGCDSFTLTNGYQVTVKSKYEAHISKANMATAFAWLRENDYGGLIKNQVNIIYPKGSERRAATMVTRLKKAGESFTEKESVHASTLKSFVTEQMGQEKCDLPQDLFGVFEVTIATVADPTKAKRKKSSAKVSK